jgi:hypothetical protein
MDSTHHHSPRTTGRRPPERSRRAARTALLGVPFGICALLTTACFDEEGSGDLATYTVENFVDPEVTGLSVIADVDVEVRVDPNLPQSAEVRIDDNLADRAWVTLDDEGTLTIASDGLGDIEPSTTPLVLLTVKRLDVIENHGEGAVHVTGLDSGDLDVRNDDDGSITAAGTADSLELASSSSGSVDLADLVSRRVDLADTDDGPISVHATDVIEGSISGDADVVVSGDPTSTDVELDGAGELVTA